MISEDTVTLRPAGLTTRITDISVMTITDGASWISVMSRTTRKLRDSRRETKTPDESKISRNRMSTTRKLRDNRKITPKKRESRVNPTKMLTAKESRIRVEKEIE